MNVSDKMFNLHLMRQANKASSLCDKHCVLVTAPKDLAPH